MLLKTIELHKSDIYNPTQKVIHKIKRVLNLLIDVPVESNKGAEYRNFRKRMVKYRDYILTFLNHPEVPPDNNGSERAIRNVKVKLKVSGQFKTDYGAKSFAILRSIVDTVLSKNKTPFKNL